MRAAAKARGVRWRDVLDAYSEVRDEQREKRDRPNEIRRFAWSAWTADLACKRPFWTCGFRFTLLARVERSDITAIDDYDVFADHVARSFPEFQSGGGDVAQRVWDFLLSPYDKMPSRLEMLESAIGRAAAAAGEDDFVFEGEF